MRLELLTERHTSFRNGDLRHTLWGKRVGRARWSSDSWDHSSVEIPPENSGRHFDDLPLDRLMSVPTIITLLSAHSDPKSLDQNLPALARHYLESVQSRIPADLQLVGCPRIRLEESLRQLTQSALTKMPLESPVTWLFLDSIFGVIKNTHHLPEADRITTHKSLLADTQATILRTLSDSRGSSLTVTEIQQLAADKDALFPYLHDCVNKLRQTESPHLWPESEIKRSEVRREFQIYDFFEKIFKLDSGAIAFHDFDLGG